MSTNPQKTILISAGHTNVPGQDRGVVGNGFIEGDLACELRDAVAAEVRRRRPSWNVLEDGADGANESLKKAIALARKSVLGVEFHWNAGPPAATGIEVLSKIAHAPMAKVIAGAIHLATGLRLRGIDGWKSDKSGQHPRLGFCEAGGMIVEVCFISNPADMRAYKKNFSSVVNNLATAICGRSTPESEVPSVEAEPAGTTGPGQKPLSELPLPAPPPDSTITGVQNISQDLAGLSANSESGAAAPSPALSEQLSSMLDQVPQVQDKLDAVNNAVGRFQGNSFLQRVWSSSGRLLNKVWSKIWRFLVLIGAWLAGVPTEVWVVLVAVIVFSVAYYYRKPILAFFRSKFSDPPTK